MGRKVGLALLAAVVAGAGSAVGPTAPASADTLTHLNATQLVSAMGAGWNLGNQLEASINGVPSETSWGNPTITQALIDNVRTAGFTTIRIPVSYLSKIGSGPDYTIDSAWLDRIQQVVDYAYGRGMYVVVNMHGDGFKSVAGAWFICDASNQSTIKEKYQKVWQQVASRFKDYDERLVLESMNEEFDGQYGNPTQPCYSNINAYNQIFVDTVRQTGGNNSSRWLLIPGWNTNIDYTAGDYGFQLPTDRYRSSSIPSGEQRLMISAHYYDPWEFAGEENGNITQWGPNATDPYRTSSWGQHDHMDRQLKRMYDAFVTRGYPVFIGEYGSVDKTSADASNAGFRADYARTLVASAKKYGAATAYWDNGYTGPYGFALFNRSAGTVTQPGIISAIMSAVGGTLPTTTTTTRPTTTTTTTSSRPTTTTTTTSGGSKASVTWTVENSWPGGLQAVVTVTNLGSGTINGWTVGATLPSGQTVGQVYNGSFTQSGRQVSISNASYNGTLAPGASASTGMSISWTTDDGPATNLTLNGVPVDGTPPTTTTTTTTSSRPTTTTTATTTTTRTTTTTTTTTSGGGRSCSAAISVIGSWGGGWQGEVTVTAGPAAISGWTVSWAFPGGVSLNQAWNAAVSGTSSVTASDAGWNAGLGASASTTWGFIASGAPATPAVTCTAR